MILFVNVYLLGWVILELEESKGCCEIKLQVELQ